MIYPRLPPRLGHLLVLLANLPARRRAQRARLNPRSEQLQILRGYLRRNADTDFGQHHDYASIQSIEAFQNTVPVRSYEDFEPWIERIRQGEPGVLTAEPVLMMEKTSGSTGPAKYIPYTATLRREFQSAAGVWLADLYLNRPALLSGRQYWSISPVARQRETTPGGLPVGFDDDTEYLGTLERHVLRSVMAVPGAAISQAATVETFRRITLRHLMGRKDLRLISVWNPSFLTLLLRDLPDGYSPSELWPELSLISCWTDAAAAHFLPELATLFPGVEIQGKGLLSTEGVISVPEIGAEAPKPALTSHFLEFLGDDGHPHCAWQLEAGRRYDVVITTGGGLARYATGDRIEVTASGGLVFTGRGDQVSDLAGEKLSEPFVAGVLGEASQRFSSPAFLMLAPEWGQPPHYTLLTEAHDADDGAHNEAHDQALARFVEQRLRTSVHYDYCRRLGQLAAVRVVPVHQAQNKYLDACLAQGQRAGDVKPPCLRKDLGWRQRLAPGIEV